MSDPRLSFGPELAGSASGSAVDALDSLEVVVKVGTGIDPTATTAVAALVSMLIRLFPHTSLSNDAAVGPNPWGVRRLSELQAALRSVIPRAPCPPEARFVIGVGAQVSGADIWIGGGDWTVRLARRPQVVEACRIAVGLHAASAQAVAEAMKVALGPLGLIHVPLGDELVWNLLDYRLGPAPVVDLARELSSQVVFFGAGSVGSSTVGVATCIPGLTGTAVVVDPDSFDPKQNPYRYPASLGTETGPKAMWLLGLLKKAGWSATGFVGRVGQWVAAQPTPGIEGVVVSSVDTVAGRLEVTDALARTNLTLGVGGLALHLQREHHDDELACPFCQFVSLDPPMSQIQARAAATGLPVERVAQLELRNEMLTAEDVAVAVSTGKVHPEQGAELVGRRIDDLLRRAYAEASVPVAGGYAQVSAPYVSQMAGVLATGELVKAAAGLPLVDRRVDLDLSGMPLGVVSRRPRDVTGRCVCSFGLRRRWAAKLYGEPWTTPDPLTKSSLLDFEPATPTPGERSTAPTG